MPECFLAYLWRVLNSLLTLSRGGYQAVKKSRMGSIQNQFYHWDLWFSLSWIQEPGKKVKLHKNSERKVWSCLRKAAGYKF